MMCEVQGPGGRYRLGEVVHGQLQKLSSSTAPAINESKQKSESAEDDDVGGRAEDVKDDREKGESTRDVQVDQEKINAESELPKGEHIQLDVESEMKELGMHVLICSVAWETADGRRTFQRFLKFNVGHTYLYRSRFLLSYFHSISWSLSQV